ncbi:DUF2157 domain-containing protein [Thorsellia kenyensis]|uniref:DUF2157 domain-containing protein n=1 Tax=Thorsellia kenyensis TaxID=1549888 RepID=A0ABV6C8G2_9GAMM
MQNISLSLSNKNNFTLSFFMLSIVLFCSSIISFIAANWSVISISQKLIVVQGVIICSGAICISGFFTLDRWQKKAVFRWVEVALIFILFTAVGALYALIGQTYETSLDAWQFFLLWTCLILPFALYIHHTFIWLFLLIIANSTLFLMTEQISSLDQFSYCLPAFFCFSIYLGLSYGFKYHGWLTQLLLLCAFVLVYFQFLIDNLFSNNLLFLFFLIIIGCSKLGSHLQREPISFIQQTFFLLIVVNTKIAEVLIYSSKDDSLSYLIFTISAFISCVLFFSYLRMVYNNWNSNGDILSDDIRSKASKIKNVCIGLLGFVVAISSTIFFLSLIGNTTLITYSLSTHVLFVIIIYAQKKIFSEKAINQQSFAILFALLQFVLINEITSYYWYSHDLSFFFNLFIFCLFLFPYLIYIYFIKNKYSRILIGVFAMAHLYYEYFHPTDPILSVFTLVLLVMYLMKDAYTFKHPYLNAAQKALHSEIILIVFYLLNATVILGFSYSSSLENNYIVLYHILPFITMSLLVVLKRLPNYFTILGLLLSLVSFYISREMIWFPIAISMLTLSTLSQSIWHRVCSWLFVFFLLIINYYYLDILLIEKSHHLLKTGVVLFLFSVLCYYLPKTIRKSN